MNAEPMTDEEKKRRHQERLEATRVLAIKGPRIPFHKQITEKYPEIDISVWRTLTDVIFPNATSGDSILMAIAYCKSRKLDILKRSVHIVPIWDKVAGAMRDTIWPGIGELRITAFRTGEYAGRCDTVWGPEVTQKVGVLEVTFPLWAQVSVYRRLGDRVVEFAGPQVRWLETYATRSRQDKTPNDMWAGRPYGQIDKCAEAAALRAAFPEEVGSDYTADEVQHDYVEVDRPQRINADGRRVKSLEDLTPVETYEPKEATTPTELEPKKPKKTSKAKAAEAIKESPEAKPEVPNDDGPQPGEKTQKEVEKKPQFPFEDGGDPNGYGAGH